MKSWNTSKKWVFIIVFVLVCIRIGYIVFRGDLIKQYVVENAISIANAETVPCVDISQVFSLSHDNLNKLEIILSGIADDKQGSITVQILKSGEVVYQTNVSLSGINNNEWKKLYVNLPIEIGQEYVLKMNTTGDYTAIPNVLMVDGSLAVLYGCLNPPGIMDKVVNSSLWLLLLAVIYVLLDQLERIQLNFKKVLDHIKAYAPIDVVMVICEILLCMAFVGGSGIEFQNPTKIIFYIISILSAYRLTGRNAAVNSLFVKTSHKIWLYMLYFYCAFSLVGQRLFVYPLSIYTKLAYIFVFSLTLLWSIPVVNSFIWVVMSGWKVVMRETSSVSGNKKRFYGFLALIIALLVLPAAYVLFAHNPGISSVDTKNTMIINAKNLHGMKDWHPAFYCMVLRAILTVWDSTYAVILVQYLFWLYVMLEFLLYLRSKGLKDGIIIAVAAFCGFNASNFLHLNTIWKDIPYTLSILWSLIILSKLLIDEEKYKKKWFIYLELVVSLIGIFFYKKNGVASFAIIVLFMIWVLYKNKKMWASLGITVAVICFIKGPVYQYFDIEDTGRYGMYIGLGQDILGAYYYGDDISEETLKLVNVMTEYNNAEYSYTPTWSQQSYDLDVEPLTFIKCYIDMFWRNPVVMSRAILARVDAVWDVFPGKDSVRGGVIYTGTMDADAIWTSNYPKRVYTSLVNQMYVEICYTLDNQCIEAVEWRCGLFTLLGFISVVVLFVKRGLKKNILLIAPIIGQIISLLLSTGWSDFRYFWPLNLMNMCMILYVIVLIKEDKVIG